MSGNTFVVIWHVSEFARIFCPLPVPSRPVAIKDSDFETFATFLSHSTLKDRSFVGLVSNRPLAFACTLDKKIPSKVRRNVKTIVSSGTSISGIYMFCSRDLAVARRHELQQWAHDDYGVDLEDTGRSSYLGTAWS